MNLTPKRKYSFHLADDLYDRVRERCFSMKGAPQFLTINAFVSRALESELKKDQSKLRLGGASQVYTAKRTGEVIALRTKKAKAK